MKAVSQKSKSLKLAKRTGKRGRKDKKKGKKAASAAKNTRTRTRSLPLSRSCLGSWLRVPSFTLSRAKTSRRFEGVVKNADKAIEKGVERYTLKAVWAKMSKEERKETDGGKAGSRQGKQFVLLPIRLKSKPRR